MDGGVHGGIHVPDPDGAVGGAGEEGAGGEGGPVPIGQLRVRLHPKDAGRVVEEGVLLADLLHVVDVPDVETVVVVHARQLHMKKTRMNEDHLFILLVFWT